MTVLLLLLSLITCWIGFKGYVQKQRDLVQLTPVSKKLKGKKEKKDDAFLLKLRQLMETERPYLNPDLTLTMLAESLEMKPRQLSSKINQNCDQNFYDLINSYRVAAFKDRLHSEDRDKLSILGHAYECGFYSKSTFNHVFKKSTQLTPSEYLNKLKNAS